MAPAHADGVDAGQALVRHPANARPLAAFHVLGGIVEAALQVGPMVRHVDVGGIDRGLDHVGHRALLQQVLVHGVAGTGARLHRRRRIVGRGRQLGVKLRSGPAMVCQAAVGAGECGVGRRRIWLRRLAQRAVRERQDRGREAEAADSGPSLRVTMVAPCTLAAFDAAEAAESSANPGGPCKPALRLQSDRPAGARSELAMASASSRFVSSSWMLHKVTLR